MIIFSTQNFVLLIAALINLLMTFVIFKRGIKNKINLYFGLLTFFNFLWSFSLLMSSYLQSNLIAEISYRTAYFSAIGIAVTLYYFCFYYPYQNKNVSRWINFFIVLICVVLSILVYTKIHIISFTRSTDLFQWSLEYNKVFYNLYSIIFFTLVISAVYFLIDKLKGVDGIFYRQIKNLIITIIVGLFFGSYFNLILCYFNNWDYIWFGPVFTLFMNIVVFRAIRYPKEKING
jgi:hypothetical protein